MPAVLDLKKVVQQVENISYKERMTHIEFRPINSRRAIKNVKFSYEVVTPNKSTVVSSRISDFKKYLSEVSNSLNKLTTLYEKLTWKNDLTATNLKEINKIIALSKDVIVRLHEDVKTFENLKGNSLYNSFSKELEGFKNSVEDFHETTLDVESIFFRLPHNETFTSITKELNKL